MSPLLSWTLSYKAFTATLRHLHCAGQVISDFQVPDAKWKILNPHLIWPITWHNWWLCPPWHLSSLGSHYLKLEKVREFQKNIYFCFIDYAKAFDCVDHKKLWKILREIGIPDHLICLLRNLYAGQKATVRPRHGTTDWFQIGKGVCQGCILSPCLFNLYAEYIMRNAGLEEAQLESRLQGEISIISDMQMTPPLWQKVKRN